MSPGDFVSEKHLSDVLFQESGICLDSNLPKEYPGREQDDIPQNTDSTQDTQTDNNKSPLRDRESSVISEADKRDTSLEETANTGI